MADPNALPDWYSPEQNAQAQAAPGTPLPSWYGPEPESVTVSATRGADEHPWRDAAANVATGVARIPGAIIGAPHMLGHTLDWLLAHVANTGAAAVGQNLNLTGADVDKHMPVPLTGGTVSQLPSGEDVDKGIFKGISAVAGKDVQPYEPTSVMGKLAQAAITGVGAGAVDPAAFFSAAKAGIPAAEALAGMGTRAVKSGIAATAANGTQQFFPNTPALAAAAAMTAHTAAGAGAAGATRAYNAIGEPLVNPNSAAEQMVGKSLLKAPVDATLPPLANPSPAALDNATAATKAATDALGTGLDDYTAGGNVRAGLQGRSDALTGERSAAADAAYENFRQQQPLEGAKLGSFMQAPAFRSAVKAASDGSLNRLQKPLTDFWDFNEAGDPALRPNAAVPPDILQRIKGALDDQINSATGNVGRGDLTHLRNQYVGMLDKEYPDTYPKTRADFAAASRPLDPLQTGAPGKVLDSQTAFGNRTYTMPQDKIGDLFLKSKATRSDYDSLIKSYGGDAGPTTALKNLRENLIGKVQGAINPDGTLSQDAFARAVKPYTASLNMWFPALAKEFSTATSAQGALDTMKSQASLASSIEQGGLRNNGLVTGSSVSSWLSKNKTALAKSQAPGVVMRLQQIAKALPEAPTGATEAALEAAPILVGASAAGLEGGVLGGITHNIPGWLADPRMSQFRNAYNQTVEKVFSDPAEAKRVTDLAAKRGGSIKSIRAVLMEAAAAVPGATIASGATSTPSSPP